MIAPRMIGWGVRDMYVNNEGFPVLIAIGNDPNGQGQTLALSLASGIGALKKNGCAIWSSFKEETLLDLLSEHTWAGAILFFFRSYYEIATKLGASPEAIILELYASGELAEIAQSMKEMGLFRQLITHSETSRYGELTRGPLFATKELKELIEREAKEILDGTFDREIKDRNYAKETIEKLMKENESHPMEQEERKLYNLLGRS